MVGNRQMIMRAADSAQILDNQAHIGRLALAEYFVDGEIGRPALHKGLMQGAVLIGPVVINAVRGERRHHRGETLRPFDGGKQLRLAGIGKAVGTDLAVRFIQLDAGLDGIDAVIALIMERLEIAARSAAPPDILGDHNIAVPGIPFGV